MRSRFFFAVSASAALLAALLGSCATNTAPAKKQGEVGTAYNAASDADYQRLGLSRSTIAPWEDGMRTTGAKGSYEWWYFDSTLDDGSTLVIVFYTKNQLEPNKPLEPWLSFDLTRPDGTSVHKTATVDAKDFSASKEGCDVRIGENRFSGDLKDYAIHVAIEDVKADISLRGEVPAWRPNTGHILFQNAGEHYFAWLPAVPQGRVEGRVSIAGKSESVAGVGYHDHNWGDVSMLDLIHDWYWGRAQIGSYSVIASYIVAADAYGRDATPIFMLARDGKIIADDAAKVKFSTEDVYIDEHTGKPVAGKVVYDFDDGTSRYRVTFRREGDLTNTRFIDGLSGLKRIFASLANFDGAYLRFTGEATVERFEGDSVVEAATEKSAVWELMYFGHAPKK